MYHGILFVIVGPSGAGKDTLLDGARLRLAGDRRFAFPRRVITRPADAGGEIHLATTPENFDAMEAAGGFLASWRAHDLAYGLPIALMDELAKGRHVVVNASRRAITILAARVPRLIVLHVTAPISILARRLAARGREGTDQIANRLARAEITTDFAAETITIVNDASPIAGVDRLVAVLEGAARRLTLTPLPIDTGRLHTAFLPEDSPASPADYTGTGRIEIAGGGRSIRAELALLDAGTLLAPHQIGLSKEAFRTLGLAAGTEVTIARTPPQHSRNALRRKIAGDCLDEGEYETVLGDIVAGRYPDSELAAFLVAATRSLTDEEVIALARVRTRFGSQIDWSEPIVVDKHSMGGIPGSRITMIVTPIVAAHGLAMPKTSSRAITSAAGTADAMEVLARVDLDYGDVRRVVAEARGCIAWNGRMNHSALDDVMNAITRPLALDSNRWSVASIISKKRTAGATHVAIDLPYGHRAKLPSVAEAQQLGNLFERVGRAAGLRVEAIATVGAAPIGRGIGPALEVRDVLQVLEERRDAPADLRAKALDFAGRILAWDPAIGDPASGRRRAEALLGSGAARVALDRIVGSQGRHPSPIPPASQIRVIQAERSGVVARIDGWAIAGIARRAGAPQDKGAGIDLRCGIGSTLNAGDPLFIIHSNDAGNLEAAEGWARERRAIMFVDEAFAKTG